MSALEGKADMANALRNICFRAADLVLASGGTLCATYIVTNFAQDCR
jgi:hypothetical protein